MQRKGASSINPLKTQALRRRGRGTIEQHESRHGPASALESDKMRLAFSIGTFWICRTVEIPQSRAYF